MITDLTPQQIARIKYNDIQVRNYKWNIKKKIEEEQKAKEEIEAYKKRMREKKVEYTIRPHDYYIKGNTIIDEEEEVAAGFEFNK
jgi:sensor histidine kinase YesM